MIFSTPVFLYLFLPVVFVAYFLCGRRNSVLLAASILFYYWGEAGFTLLLILSICMNFLFGKWIHEASGPDRQQRALAFGILANLLLLGIFKYAGFFVSNLNSVVGLFGGQALLVPEIHLPLGISFFTFQAMSYLIDLKRGDVPYERSFRDLALYISLFPQLVAGPIVRYRTIVGDLHHRGFYWVNIEKGTERFIIGVIKKVLIADPCGMVADQIFASHGSDLSSPVALLGILAFTLQIYFDFSGYSDMAIGLGRIFGFHFLENFRHPYASLSIQEFWRNWHISLSSFFRDYIYIPLGGSRTGPIRTIVNLWIVFLLCGLWHGASWAFVIWGAWQGLFLTLERTSFGRWLEKLPVLLRSAYVWLAAMMGWVFFRSESVPQALNMFDAAFFGGGWWGFWSDIGRWISPYQLAVLLSGIVLSWPLRRRIEIGVLRRIRVSGAGNAMLIMFATVRTGVYLIALAWALSAMAAGTYQAFIYFRF